MLHLWKVNPKGLLPLLNRRHHIARTCAFRHTSPPAWRCSLACHRSVQPSQTHVFIDQRLEKSSWPRALIRHASRWSPSQKAVAGWWRRPFATSRSLALRLDKEAVEIGDWRSSCCALSLTESPLLSPWLHITVLKMDFWNCKNWCYCSDNSSSSSKLLIPALPMLSRTLLNSLGQSPRNYQVFLLSRRQLCKCVAFGVEALESRPSLENSLLCAARVESCGFWWTQFPPLYCQSSFSPTRDRIRLRLVLLPKIGEVGRSGVFFSSSLTWSQRWWPHQNFDCYPEICKSCLEFIFWCLPPVFLKFEQIM